MTLGDRIAAARTREGLSQLQLAQKLGVQLFQVSDWEQGASEPSLEEMAALCRALGVSSDFLLLGEETKACCLKCGQVLEPGTNFCPRCGQAQQKPPEKGEYCLVLHDPAFAEEAEQVFQICREGQFWPDFPCTEETTLEEMKKVLAEAPVVLFRGLSRSQAVQLWKRFPYPSRLTIHWDPDGGTPVKQLLLQSGGYPTQTETARTEEVSQPSGGMTFGGTVAAVIVGVLAALLILSIL